MKKFQVEIRNNPVLKNLFLEHGKKIGLKINCIFFTNNVHSFQVGVHKDNSVTYSSSCFFEVDEYPIISMAEFLELGIIKTVKLNEEYTATITKDNIRVGCQDFNPKVIKELLTAWESIK